jgi:hypothetical protein
MIISLKPVNKEHLAPPRRRAVQEGLVSLGDSNMRISSKMKKPGVPEPGFPSLTVVAASQRLCRCRNPSQMRYHGVWPGLGLPLQSFLTSLLDLLDLANDEAQPRYIALQLGNIEVAQDAPLRKWCRQCSRLRPEV